MCLALGHKTVTHVGIEPRTSQFRSPTLYYYATTLPILSLKQKQRHKWLLHSSSAPVFAYVNCWFTDVAARFMVSFFVKFSFL